MDFKVFATQTSLGPVEQREGFQLEHWERPWHSRMQTLLGILQIHLQP